jgi:hypothetical protein
MGQDARHAVAHLANRFTLIRNIDIPLLLSFALLTVVIHCNLSDDPSTVAVRLTVSFFSVTELSKIHGPAVP